jgi:hypothetical protein
LIKFEVTDLSNEHKIERAQRELLDDLMRQIKNLIREGEKLIFNANIQAWELGMKLIHRWNRVRSNGFEFEHIEHKKTLKDRYEEKMRHHLLNL